MNWLSAKEYRPLEKLRKWVEKSGGRKERTNLLRYLDFQQLIEKYSTSPAIFLYAAFIDFKSLFFLFIKIVGKAGGSSPEFLLISKAS